MSTYDLIIRNAHIVDGTGAPAFDGDIAVHGDKIVQVGAVSGTAKREIDAGGHLVTPGFVDIHTHYDAQATWDPYMTPSSQHGVTTVVMGNCGVGFAPCKPENRDELIELMEAVEDIPNKSMHEGIEWEWESFPEFMDALERRDHVMDYAVQVPHCAVRVDVMGKRGIDNEDATPEDIRKMSAIVKEGMEAGALGFSTSRTDLHKTLSGDAVPGTFAAKDELFAIADALGEPGHGVFQISATHVEMDQEVPWMEEIARKTGQMVTFNLQQTDLNADLYKDLLGRLSELNAEGLTNLRGQFSGRPVGILMGWETSVHPFILATGYNDYRFMEPDQRIAELKKPEVRDKIINSENVELDPFAMFIVTSLHKVYPMPTTTDYEPSPDNNAVAIAEQEGRTAKEVIYDAMMEEDGHGLLYFPLFGYAYNDFSAIEETMKHPQTGISLADGGAHLGAICDGSTPTFMLTHWTRDRTRGPKMSIEFIVKQQTSETAQQYGLFDRGVIAPGMKADINIIDYDRLTLPAPRMIHDLPAGGRRLYQGASGYIATIVSGVVTYENDVATGALPGKLIRGRQEKPELAVAAE